MDQGRKLGVSDLLAIVVFIGLAILLSLMFLALIYGDYVARQDLVVVEKTLLSEKLNTVVRFVDYSEDQVIFFFKRLDNGDRVSFFLYTSGGYVNCSNVLRVLSGGYLVETRVHSTSEILVVNEGNKYSFSEYAKSRGLPSTGDIPVCTVKLQGNSVVGIRVAQPLVEGYNYTELYATNRAWRLLGVLGFKVASPTVISVGSIEYYLPNGTLLKIQVNSTESSVNLTSSFAWNLDLNATAVYVNEVLLPSSGRVKLSKTPIHPDSLYSSLSIEVYPGAQGQGYIKVRYGGQDIVKGNDEVFVRVTGWTTSLNTPLNISMSNVLYASGVARAVYVSKSTDFGAGDLSVFIVTYLNNKPYLVDVYSLELTSPVP